MASPSVPKTGSSALGAVVSVLSTNYTVSTGKSQLLHRVRLDTFDRRLDRAGLTLEHQSLASGEQLVLGRATSSSPVRQPMTAVSWPALAEAVPLGPVREAIAPVIGIRALMVISDERRRVRLLALHNEDAKIVARVELDEPASPMASPVQLRVLPLLGYEGQVRRVSRLLDSLGEDLLASPGKEGEGGIEAAPRSPVTERTAPVTDRAAPATALMAGALREFLGAMVDNLPGLLDDVDTEFLHDFRVAVRRTRATLKLGRPLLTDVMGIRWEPAFKGLGDLTTPLRDLDVYELGLPAMGGWLVAADPADLEPLAVHLRHRRTAERSRLLRALRTAKFRLLLTQWEQELDLLVDTQEGGRGGDVSAGRWADRSISKAYRRVARDGAAISGESPAQDLHSLRKRCKELRYALEVCAPVLDSAPRKRAVGDLKDLQDVLGRFQDCEVQREALHGFAEEMMSDGTSTKAVLAMGELIGHLDAEQDRARQEFAGAFARFIRPSSQQIMHRLGRRP